MKTKIAIKRGQCLKTLRKGRCLSQRQLAKKCRISPKLLQAYEQGVKDAGNMTVTTFTMLAKGLDVSMDDLADILKILRSDS